MYCRVCGKKVEKFCHNYMCEECCRKATNKKINDLITLHDPLL